MAASAPNASKSDRSTKNLTMGDLMQRFRCEETCRGYLERLRWPEGVRCTRCDSDRVTTLKNRNQYECRNPECGYHFSVTAGTKIHDSHLPLWKWFLVTFLMVHAKKGMSAKQIQRMVGGSYKTAWHLCHRIRAAMAAQDSDPLSGTVEVDETFIGGERSGKGPGYKGNKTVVMAAVERDGRARLRVVPSRNRKSIRDFVDEHVDEEAEAVYTDAYRAYRGAMKGRKSIHGSVHHSGAAKQWVHGKIHTNTVEGVFSLLDRAIMGSYHKVGSKHLQAYLHEVEWKYNNRSNPYLFRETLKAILFSDPLEYKRLTTS